MIVGRVCASLTPFSWRIIMSEHATLPNTPAEDNPADRYHDARGRFKKGNPGGPGNPYARETALIRQMVHEEADVECLRVILRAIIARAKEGDLAAARFVYTYAYGKPTTPIDPDRLDLHEWQIYQDTADAM